MLSHRYITLIASLPSLPHFERAERLPINRPRLEQRLGLLVPEHAEELRHAEDLLFWERLPLLRSAAQYAQQYRKTMEAIRNPALRAFIEFRVDQRNLVAAFRKRRIEQRVPLRGEVWGAGWRADWIVQRWDRPDFGLSGHYPWVRQVKAFIEAGDALGLEHLLMQVLWDRLCRIADEHPFAFEDVFAYVFRWDILNRRLAYGSAAATARFQALVMEALSEHTQLFDRI